MSLHSVLILGSGPVVIGQAAEFDYAGTQACRALRDEGVRTILLNSNPATIMTDPDVADVVYLEPLTVESVERIIDRERPDGILAGLGGQTALNLAVALSRTGVLERTGVPLLGTPLEAIEMAEDRRRFRDLLERIGQPFPPSEIVEGATAEARDAAAERALERIGLPAIIRPAFTLGGSGGGIVEAEADYRERVRAGLRASPIGQVIVERCLVGWQELEYEVMRDADDTCIAVCSMENVDPLGVHTGDSIVVAPVQTLPDAVHQRLRSAALAIIRALGVEGGCNVQFALSPDERDYAVIEVNPRVSRSSALASKATGYPIARVAAQIAIGRRLAEIPNAITGTTVAAFEPALDYVVVKLPRFPFDKFPRADRTLGSQMKATGEVMAIDRTFGAALNKALRGLEQTGAGRYSEDAAWGPTLDYLAGPIGRPGQRLAAWQEAGREELMGEVFVGQDGLVCANEANALRAARPLVLRRFLQPSDSRLWRLLALLRRGLPAQELHAATGIAPWFLAEMERSTDLEDDLREARGLVEAGDPLPAELLVAAKRAAFGDREIGLAVGSSAEAVRARRVELGLVPGFAMVDTCAAEFAAQTPYFYATYAAAGSPPEAPPVERPAALVIGSGPVRIGQGIEFDYCAVQAAATLRELGWQAVMVNSNPETVSTDFDASSRLYFEPLDAESVRAVIEAESPAGGPPLPALVQFGGQTPLNLAGRLSAAGVTLLGLDVSTIDQAEERADFAALVDRLGIPQPPGGMATSVEQALAVAERIGYPVIVRPSFVIGGLAIDFAYGPEDLAGQLAAATVVAPDRPVRLDAYLEGFEVDVDALCDGERVTIPGLIEQVERAGVHSGDSVGVFPPQATSAPAQAEIVATMRRIALALGVRGLVNAQFIVRDDGVYLLEVNPRASRTVPFVSKVTGVPMVALATRIALGERLADLGWADGLLPPPELVAVKAPVFSTAKLRGVDPSLGPGMQSTGEVIGLHRDPRVAMAKALLAAQLRPPLPGPDGAVALLSLADRDKDRLPDLAAALGAVGFRFAATRGTAAALRTLGHAVVEVARVGEEGETPRPTILETIRSGEVTLVVNTPSPQPGPVRDAASIRLAAIAEGILCLTALETALAAAHSLEPQVRERIAEVRPLGEWQPGPAAARTVMAPPV
ncbi:MAG: carbamoyl-phosphate synthase large subunit [Chloroflexota bacterium]|nr:MAG: carbamoyl-phosphate synthase large subunit [Chloroflexota bacterium]